MDLTDRHLLGDDDARHQLILAHLKLAFYIANKVNYHDSDSVVDVAISALVKAVDDYREKQTKSPISSYIGSVIGYRILDFLQKKGVGPLEQEPWMADTHELQLMVRDTMKICCNSKLEQHIFNGKLESLSDAEIADNLNKSVSFVNKKKTTLYSRFRGRWNES